MTSDLLPHRIGSLRRAEPTHFVHLRATSRQLGVHITSDIRICRTNLPASLGCASMFRQHRLVSPMKIPGTEIEIAEGLILYVLPTFAVFLTFVLIIWRVVRAMVNDLKELMLSHISEMYSRHREVSNRSSHIFDRLSDESERLSVIEFELLQLKHEIRDTNAARAKSGER